MIPPFHTRVAFYCGLTSFACPWPLLPFVLIFCIPALQLRSWEMARKAWLPATVLTLVQAILWGGIGFVGSIIPPSIMAMLVYHGPRKSPISPSGSRPSHTIQSLLKARASAIC